VSATSRPYPGTPVQPTGNPLLSGMGPAAYAQRANVPNLTIDGKPQVVPMRVATDFVVDEHDPDPRGYSVIGADGAIAGTIVDIWVDRSEPQVRHLEVELAGSRGRVLLPFGFFRVKRNPGRVIVGAITAAQFADVPKLAHPEQVTRLEEDKIRAYFAGGYLYAEPGRAEPFI